MRKINENLTDIKEQLQSLKGQEVSMLVNRGRRKIQEYEAIIEDLYPSVFTVKIHSPSFELMSYSYSDVLCGDVKITQKSFLR